MSCRLSESWSSSGPRPATPCFTRYHNYEGSPYQRLIRWNELRNAPRTDLAPELQPYAETATVKILDKRAYTASTDEGRELLAGYTDLYLCGIATDGCVFKTALDAFNGDYTPWVIKDACASNATRHSATEVHQSALMLMSRLIGSGQLIQSAAVASALQTSSAHLHSA